MATTTIPADVLAVLTPDQERRLLVAVTVREVAAFTQGSGLLAKPQHEETPVLHMDSLPEHLHAVPQVQRAAYAQGLTDEPDPLAPARGVLVALTVTVLVAAFTIGALGLAGAQPDTTPVRTVADVQLDATP